MRHFKPCPINDDRDHWLMFGDGQAEVKHSEEAVRDEIRDYPKWWTQIVRFNSADGICRNVTADFEADDDVEQPESPESQKRWIEGRVL